MSVTVWGCAGGTNMDAVVYDRFGRIEEAHSYDRLRLELPDAGIAVDADHQGERLGDLVHAELDDSGKLRCVAVLDDEPGEQLAQVEQPVFFSGQYALTGAGTGTFYTADEAQLIGLSLTFAPAVIGLPPLTWRRGDVRRSLDRHSGWPCGWQLDEPLLARALGFLESPRLGVETRCAARIVDRGGPPPMLEFGYASPLDYAKLGPGRRSGGRGGIEYSAHRGVVLAVY